MRFIFYFVLLRWFFRICFLAQTDPVETLTVRLEGDVGDLLKTIEDAVEKAKDELEELGDSGEKVGPKIKGGAAIAGAAFGLAAGAAGKLLDVVLGLAVAIPQFFANLGREAIGANAQFETFTTQFETLLGSGSAAKQRLDELAKFGVETPFELPEVVQANIQLQTFGGNALATEKNLKLLGDAAAATAAPFSETAVWFGRMFSALQGGRPFGEASARLQELAILAPEVRTEMEAMQKQGKSGAEIWAFFADQVGDKFGGAMEKLAKTFGGVTSNLADFKGELIRKGGEEFFNEIRLSAVDLFAFLDSNQDVLIGIAQDIGQFAADAVASIREFVGGLGIGPDIIEGLQSAVSWLKSTVEAAKEAAGAANAFGAEYAKYLAIFKPVLKLISDGIVIFAGFIAKYTAGGIVIAKVGERVKEAGGVFGALKQAFTTAAQGMAIISAVIKGVIVTIDGLFMSIKGIGKAFIAFVKGDIVGLKSALNEANTGFKQTAEGGVKAANDSLRASAASINEKTRPAVKELTKDMEDLGDAAAATADIIEDMPLLDPAQLEKFGDRLDEAVQNRAKKQAELEQATADKISQIITKANQKRLDIDQKFNDALVDLAQDSEDKRANIIAETRQELADLEKSTDQQIASRRSEFDKNELRQTEDHLKAMRRLQEDFLFNLDDAVRDRDAGAIVDLQRQFKKESAQREEDFSTNQNRQGQDFSEELAGIRENEASRREELLTAQSTELDNITKFEEEKRLDIETRRAEEQEKLEINLAETLQRENDNFIARQAALDEALQKQLESIAKNLADQKDVTEEGAREILETFDQFFGIGGDIDKIMEDFARKRKIRADITVAFQGVTSTPEPQTPAEAIASGGGVGGGKRLGGVQEFATGGTLIANKPTLALFGEKGPEVAQFTPMSELSNGGQSEPGRVIIELTGGAPPGIGTSEVDQIAGVLLRALDESGALN